MNMKALFVFGAALAMSATLDAQGRKSQPAQQGLWNPLAAFDFFITTPLEGKLVKGAPYSAQIETETVQTLGDGNRIVSRSSGRVYRDAEGRVRREERKGATETITITDPVRHMSFTLDPATRTTTRTVGSGFSRFMIDGLQMSLGRFGYGYRPAQNGYTSAWNRSGRGAGVRGRDEYLEEPLPNRTIEGVTASGIRKTTTIPQGAIGNEQPIKTVTEEWTSVDLQVLVMTEVNDPRTGRTTYRLTNINRAEPDPALFKVPTGYRLLTGGLGRAR